MGTASAAPSGRVWRWSPRGHPRNHPVGGCAVGKRWITCGERLRVGVCRNEVQEGR